MSSITSNLTPSVGAAPEIVTDKLTLNGTSVTGVAVADTDLTSSNLLVATDALATYLTTVKDLSTKLDPQSTYYQDLVVMSTSLIDKYFDKSEWDLTSWTINQGVLYGQVAAENSAKILSTAYLQKGIYLLQFTILSLPSGYIEITYNNTVIKDIDTTGTHQIEIEITDTDLPIVFKAVNNSDQVIINNCGLYYVSDKFYQYVLNLVKTHSTVDVDNYVTKTTFTQTLQDYLVQFKAATDSYLTQLTAHTKATNPHNITPALIGAATTNHEHSNYVTKSNVQSIILSLMSDYAKVEHTHSQYVTYDTLNNTIQEKVNTYIESLVTFAPNILTRAPLGNLPSRFMRTDINPPVQILLPSTPTFKDPHTYSQVTGVITTNKEGLIDTCAAIYSSDETGVDIAKSYFDEQGVTFRLQLHYPRSFVGYKVTSTDSKITRWEIYSSDTQFVHSIENWDATNSYQDREILFDAPITTDTFIIVLYSAEYNEEQIVHNLKVTPIFENRDLDSIRITNSKFGFCVPTNGVNQIVTMPDVIEERSFTPAEVVDNQDYFIFASKGSSGSIDFVGSYFPPEYGNIRKGEDVLSGQFTDIELDTTQTFETYTHPAFGTLRLREGSSKANTKISDIYSVEDVTWQSMDTDTSVVIEQTFNSDDVLLMGYMLSWRNANGTDTIPEIWTLTVEGTDENGDSVTVVYDSIKSFYPFYSAADDDIVYYKKFDIKIRVKRILLAMYRKDGASGISLNKLGLYTSERFYSIPENTMYLGTTPVSQTCLGWVNHNALTGYTPSNLVLGKSCVIPLNNLEKLTPNEEYVIPNPFLSTDIQASVTAYGWVLADNATYAQAYISEITPRYIKVIAETSATYAVSIIRGW